MSVDVSNKENSGDGNENNGTVKRILNNIVKLENRQIKRPERAKSVPRYLQATASYSQKHHGTSSGSSIASGGKGKILSQEEREEMFMKNLKPFKARKVNTRVMQSQGDLGLPKVSKRQSTTFHEFNLATSARAAKRSESNNTSFSRSEVSDRPARSRTISTGRSDPPFRRSLSRHEDSVRLDREKREKEIENEKKKSVFKANPLPDFSHIERFRKPQLPITIAKTPLTLLRSELSDRLLQRRREEEEVKAKTEASFIAHGLPQTTYSPERLKRSSPKKATLPFTPYLQSQERATNRKAFEDRRRVMKENREKELHRVTEEKKKQEERELREYRRSLIHKPLPLPR